MSSKNQLSNTTSLLETMRILRDPEKGCPWDLKQTFSTIVPYTIEETYEVADAIARGNKSDMKEELGDLLFQIVFYAQLGEEEGSFDFDEIAKSINEKLIRRHPHVFGEETLKDEQSVKLRWDEIKAQERKGKSNVQKQSIFADLPAGLPPMLKTKKIVERCQKHNVDIGSQASVLSELQSSLDTLNTEDDIKQNCNITNTKHIGQLLFSALKLAHLLGVDADHALREVNLEFEETLG